MKMWRRKSRISEGRKQKAGLRRGGFTLVELVVILAVTAILLSVAAAGLSNYQEYAIYKQNNEYARALFQAAQASLARRKASGTLEELDNDLHKLLDKNAENVGSCSVVEGSATERTSMYYLMISKNDKDKLTEDSTAAGLLYKILSPYIPDDSVFNAAICVELDPADGVVQGVFYSNRADRLIYGDGESPNLGMGSNGAKRTDTEYRKKNGLGYSGTDTSASAPSSDRLVIQNVELKNYEILELVWSLKQNNVSATSRYTVDLIEDGAAHPRVRLDIDGTKGDLTSLSAAAETHAVDTQVTFFNDSDGSEIAEAVKLPFECYLDNDSAIHLILDAVDLDLGKQTMSVLDLTTTETVEGKQVQVTRLSKDILSTLYASTAPGASNNSAKPLANSYSIRRLGLDFNREISAKVSASNDSNQDSRPRTSNNKVNPYFEEVEEVKDNTGTTHTGKSMSDPIPYEIKIANARHLYNASFEEEAQGYQVYVKGEDGTDTKENRFRSMTYLQTADFVWSDYDRAQTSTGSDGETGGQTQENSASMLAKGWAYGTIEIKDASGNPNGKEHRQIKTNPADTEQYMPFRSFERLHSGNVYNGNKKTITGLVYDYKNLPEDVNSGVNLGFIRICEGTVQELTLDRVQVRGAKAEEGIEGSKASAQGIDFVGAFCGRLYNGGQLKNCQITQGDISGRAYVGGLTGCIDLSGGKEPAGSPEGSQKAAVQEAKNGAKVRGWAFVGGIAGGSRTGDGNAGPDNNLNTNLNSKWQVIRDSENTGAVRGMNFLPAAFDQSKDTWIPKAISCLGGIVGYSRNLGIVSCESSPELTKEEQDTLTDLRTETDTRNVNASVSALLEGEGDFVGGIAGYVCQHSVIQQCSTGGGYVLGRSFVGGIAGYYDGATQGNASFTGGSGSGSDYSVNRANVLGENFVGGITGSNANLAESNDQNWSLLYKLADLRKNNSADWTEKLAGWALANQISDSTNGANGTIKSWLNQGLTVASGKYAGGITGFNSGKIENCRSEIDTSVNKDVEEKKQIVQKIGRNALCTGGIAGYNNGEITAASARTVTITAGESFVGGLVGYMDILGSVSGYRLDGGYVSGVNFVGGAIGVNFSDKIFSVNPAGTAVMQCSLNSVKGRFFTGGVIGANFAMISQKNDESVTSLYLSCSADNSLGAVEINTETGGDSNYAAFTGGFIGANMLLKAETEKPEVTSVLVTYLRELLPGFDTVKDLDDTKFQTVVDRAALILNPPDTTTSITLNGEKTITLTDGVITFIENNVNKGTLKTGVDCTLRIRGTEQARLSCRLNEVKGGVYVGGVMGCNSADTWLELSYIDNKTPVKALASVEDKERSLRYQQGGTEGGYGLDDSGKKRIRFSFAGGILGLVSENTVVDNCSNKSLVSVSANTTYHGNITEVNEGTIRSCATGTAGTMSSSYVGGIAGINGKIVKGDYSIPAEIQGCTVDGIVRGASYVGGIAVENYGEITGSTTIRKAVSGTGEFVGGVAARNHSSGLISGVTFAMGASVMGVGADYVGGVVGGNYAQISWIQDVNTAEDVRKNLTVKGKNYVGGIVGCQMSNETANGTVTFRSIIESESNLVNYASVTAFGSYAGGIVGGVQGNAVLELNSAENYGSVEAQGGTTQNPGKAGGITSELNSGSEVVNCKNYGDVKALKGEAGGIAAISSGTIRGCQVGSEDKESILKIQAMNNAGGFTAENSGTIENSTEKANLIQNVTVSDISGGKASRIGGVTGINREGGTIKACTVSDSTIQMCTDGSDIGGVAGLNETGAVIGTERTGVVDDNFTETGDSTGTENNSSNPSRSVQIKNVTLEVSYQNKKRNGNTGGIAGENAGTIQNAEYVNTTTSLEFEGGKEYGYGGIAGKNQANATVRDCDVTLKWTINGEANAIATMGGAVGINGEAAVIDGVKIHAGSSLEGKTYTYLGGVVGMNLGTVENSGCPADEVNTGGNVTIKSAKGNTGGIAGVMGDPENPTKVGLKATAQNCETGKNWSITVTDTDIDKASGGIIGYSYAKAPLTGLVNRANVTKQKGNSVGGIIGRWENQTGANLQISDCKNYGTIEGTRIGGIIGQLKYNSITVTGCENWGEIIEGPSRDACAGIIAYLYVVTEEDNRKILMENCGNYGNIYGGASKAAGFLGGGNTETNIKDITFRNCINAGDICLYNSGNDSSGFVEPAKFKTAVFERCRNYGYGYKDHNKSVLNPKFYGIAKEGTLSGCFAVANANHTAGSRSLTAATNTNVKDSYYFSDNKPSYTPKPGEVYSPQVTTLRCIYDTPSDPSVLADGEVNKNGTKTDKQNRVVFKEGVSGFTWSDANKGNPYITATVSYMEPQSTNGIEIHWTYVDNRWRTYIFKVGYKTSKDSNVIHWLDDRNINSEMHKKQKLLKGGLYCDEAGYFTSYLILNNDDTTLSRDEKATAYLSFDSNINVQEVVLEIYGVYKEDKDKPSNRNQYLSFDEAVKGKNADNFAAITEIKLGNINNSPYSPENVNVPAYDLLDWKMTYTESESKFYWSPLGGSWKIGSEENPITADPNNSAYMNARKTMLDASKRWIYKGDNENESSRAEIDAAIQKYYYRDTDAEQVSVKNLKAVLKDGKINLNWDCSGIPSYYKVELKKGNDSVYSAALYDATTKTISIPIYPDWAGGSPLTAVVTACYRKGGIDQEASNSVSITLQYYLPDPQVKLYLDNLTKENGEFYQVILENYKEYENYYRKRTLASDEILNLRVTTNASSNGDKTYFLKFWSDGTGAEKLQWSTDTNVWNDVSLYGGLGTIAVRNKDGTEDITTQIYTEEVWSGKGRVQTCAPNTGEFASWDPVVRNSLNWAGLSGTVRNGQTYSIKNLNYNIPFQNRLRGEFLVKQTVGGVKNVPVVVSSAVVDMAGSAGNATKVDMELTGLPESFSEYQVRLYPWAGKNEVAVFAYYLKRKTQDGELTELYTENDLKSENILNTKAKDGESPVNSGYLLESAGKQNGEALYRVIYSPLFENSAVSERQIIYPPNKNSTYWEKVNNMASPLPFAEEISASIKTPDGGAGTVEWTVSDLQPDDTFRVVILNADGTELYDETIKPANLTKKPGENGAWTYQWTLPEDLTVESGANSQVIRLRQNFQANEDGNATIWWSLPSGADTSGSFEVILTGYESAATEGDQPEGVQIFRNMFDSTNGLNHKEGTSLYSVTIPKAVVSNWNYPCIGVEVVHQGMVQNNTLYLPSLQQPENPRRLTFRLRLDQISAPTIQHEPGDRDTLKYQVSWQPVSQDQRDYLQNYKIILTDSGSDPQSLMSWETVSASEDVKEGKVQLKSSENSNEVWVDLDLEAFEDQEVQICIQAIARPDEQGIQRYRDSEPGGESSIHVAKRLPQADQISLSQGYVASEAIPESGYASAGLSLQAEVTNSSDQDKIRTGVTYVFQGAVYELTPEQYQQLTQKSAEQAGATGVRVTAISSENADAQLELNNMLLSIGDVPIVPQVVFSSGDEEVSMTETDSGGSLRTAALNGLTAKNAAQYVMVRTRTVSNSDISSNWGDFYLMRLPRVQLDSPRLTAGTTEQKTLVTIRRTNNGTGGDPSGDNGDDPFDGNPFDEIDQENTHRTISWNRSKDSANYGYEVTLHPSKVNAESNPEGIPEESKYDYAQYPKNYPEVKFRVIPGTNGEPKLQALYNGTAFSDDYTGKWLTLTVPGWTQNSEITLPAGASCYEVSLNQVYSILEKEGEQAEPATWYPFNGYRYEYYYEAAADLAADPAANKDIYTMTLAAKLRVINYKDGSSDYTLILPDVVQMGTGENAQKISVAATGAVEVQAIPELDQAEQNPAYIVSSRSQWFMLQTENAAVYTDGFRELPESVGTTEPKKNWYEYLAANQDSQDNLIYQQGYKWINELSAVMMDSHGAPAADLYYVAEHTLSGLTWTLKGLPFVSMASQPQPQTFVLTEDQPPLQSEEAPLLSEETLQEETQEGIQEETQENTESIIVEDGTQLIEEMDTSGLLEDTAGEEGGTSVPPLQEPATGIAVEDDPVNAYPVEEQDDLLILE